jgi:hypothetical protein
MPSLAVIRNLAEIENSGDSFSMSGEGNEKCQSWEKSGGGTKGTWDRKVNKSKRVGQEAVCRRRQKASVKSLA